MNITLQMAREDFANNFCKTLAHFLQWRDGREYDVAWDARPRRGAATLYLHPRLGIATPMWANPRRFRFIWRELRGGGSALESFARRLYLAAHLAPGPVRTRLAAHRVVIAPKPFRFADGFYLPGGNQLRWFDSAAKRCYVTVKRGFPDRYFRAQIDVRRNHDVPAPRLFDVDEDALIFTEEIFSGRAHVDASASQREALKQRTLASLEPLARATRRETSADRYAADVVATIEVHTERLPAPLATRVNAHAKNLAALLDDAPLETVMTHGDMSFGHILEDQQRIVLVDWEHAARRQRDHDELTLTLRPQLPDRFFAAIARRELEVPLILLLLEGLCGHARDSDNPALSGPGAGLIAFVAGLDQTLARSGMVPSA